MALQPPLIRTRHGRWRFRPSPSGVYPHHQHPYIPGESQTSIYKVSYFLRNIIGVFSQYVHTFFFTVFWSYSHNILQVLSQYFLQIIPFNIPLIPSHFAHNFLTILMWRFRKVSQIDPVVGG